MAGPIRISIDTDHRNAVDGLDQTGRAATGLGSKFGSLAKSAAKYIAVGAAIGGIAAVAGLGKLAVGAAEDQQAQALLSKTLQNTTNATKAQVAGVEDYISKVGVATGVTDDELRPAFSKLVTATGDVEKATKLSNLALDVSAGTGKSLEQVTTALAKAQNGSTAGLGKLGIATKDADGKTLSFADSMASLNDKFGGAAATKADTLTGKVDRLKLIASEAGESIGGALLPPLTDLADFALAKVGPAIGTVVGKVESFIGSLSAGAGGAGAFSGVLTSLASTVTGTILPAISNLVDYLASTFGPILAQVVGIVQTTVIPILASLGSFIFGTLLPAVVGIYQQIATNLKPVFDQLAATVQTSVLPTVDKLLGQFREAQPTLEKVALTVVRLVGKFADIATTILGAVLPTVIRFAGFIISNVVPATATMVVGLVKVIGALIDFGAGVVEGAQKVVAFAQRVGEKIGDVVAFFRDLDNRIKAAIGNAATMLLGIGADIVQGLVNGITNAAGRVGDAVKAIVDKIPDPIKKAMGIASPSRVTMRLGKFITEGLAVGISSGAADVRRAIDGVNRVVQTARVDPLEIGTDTSAVAALARTSSARRAMRIDLNLTADALDDLAAGRRYRRALDVYAAVGGVGAA